MATYIVIKDILNFRNRPMLADEHFIGSALLGDELELFEEPVPGETPEGTDDDQWLVDNQNRFVSRAGVALKGTYQARKAAFFADAFNKPFFDPFDRDNEDKWKISWGHVDMEIWRIWKDYKTKGKNVKVAVIDTGVVATDNDLKGRINNASVGIIGNSITDTSGTHHGTMSAGLIGANGGNAGTVIGIAPECELIIIRAGDNTFVPSNLLWGLKKALELKADIVSISIEAYKFSFLQDPATFNEMESLIKNSKPSGPLFIAAVGDQGDNSVSYPASFDGCFSVGAYSLDANKQKILNGMNNQNEFMTFLCAGNEIRTCSVTGAPAFYDASSAATAFAAGVFALLISSAQGKGLNFSSISSAIQTKNCTEAIDNGPLPSNQQGFGILSPYKLINQLNPLT